MQKIELLAPAGDLERLKVAIDFGADAVYLGGKRFSLRSAASNFSLEMIKEGVEYAHARGRKVFVTVNMILHDEDFEGLEDYLRSLGEIGVDAIIVASLSVLEVAKRVAPQMEVHISTQYSITNSSTIDFYKAVGADRVVLAREVSLDEMRALMAKASLDVEVFVHGAMCSNYSGRCTLSNYMTGRDANRGGCAQSCRWAYRLYDEGEELTCPGEPFSMSSKDLQALDVLDDLIQMGVRSLKIEGRMRSDFYIATVVGAYRKVIDAIYEGKDVEAVRRQAEKELVLVGNRPNSTGFYYGVPDQEGQVYGPKEQGAKQYFLATVLDYDEQSKIATLQIRNHFSKEDQLQIMRPNYISEPFQPQWMQDSEGKETDRFFRAMEIVQMKADQAFKVNDYIRKVE